MTQPDLFDLDGKTALVTGASRGIGEAVARLLAAWGAHVVISSRRQDACEQVAASIRAASGDATALAAHIGEPDAIDALFATLDARAAAAAAARSSTSPRSTRGAAHRGKGCTR